MNIGVLGCGVIADYHLPHITKNRNVDSVSIADPDRRKAELFARRYSIHNIYYDFEEMRRNQSLDAVHILTPPTTHASLAIKAMEAGCHVLVEKPMALTAASAAEMVAVAQREGVKLCVDHNLLFNPAMLSLSKLVKSGRAGKILHVDVQYGYDARRLAGQISTGDDRVKWALDLPGGPIADHLPHPVSILLQMIESPRRLFVAANSNRTLPNGHMDELRVLVDASHSTGLISVSFGAKPDTISVNVYASEMAIHANLSNMTLVIRRNYPVSKKILRVLDSVDQSAQLLSGMVGNTLKVITKKVGPPGDIGPVIRLFYESIERGGDSPIPGESGAKVTEVIEDIISQIVNQSPITEVISREKERKNAKRGTLPEVALVTGASGFLGSHMVSRLSGEGFQVRAMARHASRTDHLKRMDVDLVYGDLKDKDSLKRAVEGVDLVFHAGAATAGSWMDHIDTNVNGTQRLLEVSFEEGVRRFVHISSLSVYKISGLQKGTIVNENNPYAPLPELIGPYAYSKIEAEKLAFRYCEMGLPVVVVRPGIIYGPQGRMMFPHVGYFYKGKLFVLIGRGSNRLPLTYIDNVLDAIMTITRYDRAIGQAYNIVDNEEITQKEYLNRYFLFTGSRVPVVTLPLPVLYLPVALLELSRKATNGKKRHTPTRYGLASKYSDVLFDASKAKKELGWYPKISLEEGLRRTFDWYKQERAG